MSNIHAFIAKFCTIPTKSGEEEVIEHFTKYIEKSCTKQITLIEYSMPEEFKPRISKETFWGWITMFLHFEMEFDYYDPGMGKMDEVWDSTFKDKDVMEFKYFYMVHLKPFDSTSFFQYAVNLNDLSRIDKVVFRIYNPDGES